MKIQNIEVRYIIITQWAMQNISKSVHQWYHRSNGIAYDDTTDKKNLHIDNVMSPSKHQSTKCISNFNNFLNYAVFMHLFWQYIHLNSYDFQIFIALKILILIWDCDIQYMDIHLCGVITQNTTHVHFNWMDGTSKAGPRHVGAPSSLII
jgi:hypothetical protein